MSLKLWISRFLKRDIAAVINEDAGYSDHMVGQTQGPFYCGTAFCGHSTKKAARACWKKKCDAIDAINDEEKTLREAGKDDEAERVSRKRDAFLSGAESGELANQPPQPTKAGAMTEQQRRGNG
jgi:hypothetical protein